MNKLLGFFIFLFSGVILMGAENLLKDGDMEDEKVKWEAIGGPEGVAPEQIVEKTHEFPHNYTHCLRVCDKWNTVNPYAAHKVKWTDGGVPNLIFWARKQQPGQFRAGFIFWKNGQRVGAVLYGFAATTEWEHYSLNPNCKIPQNIDEVQVGFFSTGKSTVQETGCLFIDDAILTRTASGKPQ